MDELYGFAVVFAAVGSLVHHDRSNMAIYESPHAEGVGALQHLANSRLTHRPGH